ncbi:MAG: hypothetical protein M3R09_04375 [Actinomycetota bacterium]|nr:hypothetical protein [Actinomycetota bacterium]
MTAPNTPDRADGAAVPAPSTPRDDVSFVPGMGSRPLDMSKDPDRFDPDRVEPIVSATPQGPLDPARDPDRYKPPGQGQTLTDLLGEGAFEQKRDNNQWAIGLISILAFLLLVSWLFGSVLSY